MLKADFHTHAIGDPEDSIKYTPEILISRASELGFQVLAITNHEVVTYDDNLAKYAEERGILLIPGTEKNIENKHVVILNATKEAEELRTFEDLRKFKASRPEIFVLAPHPYYPKDKCLMRDLLRNIDVFDGIEFCHYYMKYFNYFNNKAKMVAEKHDKAFIGTSDSHHILSLGPTYSLVDAEQNVDSVINALKQNKVRIVSQPLSTFQCIYQFVRITLTCFKPSKKT